MNTFENLKKLVALGKKSNEEILTMMDVFLMNARISADNYNDLVDLMGIEIVEETPTEEPLV